MCKDLVRF